jgi:hypothetical protein
MAQETAQHAENPLLASVVPGESVLWQGKPRKNLFLFFTPPWFFYFIPFFALWVAFGLGIIVWLLTLEDAEDRAQNLALFLIYTLVGLYLGFGRLLLASKEWGNTFYLLTTKKVLARRGIFRPRVIAVDLDRIRVVRVLHQRKDGAGSLDFGTGAASTYIPGWPGLGGTIGPAFLAVDNVHQLSQAITQAQQQLRGVQ